jgi:hypothetical protein
MFHSFADTLDKKAAEVAKKEQRHHQVLNQNASLSQMSGANRATTKTL